MKLKPGIVKSALKKLSEEVCSQEAFIREGGGQAGKERQKRHGRLTVRERLEILMDHPKDFFELGLWAAYKMYEEWGEVPAAGVVTGIGKISGRECMVIANDATVKAGAMFPQSVKKVLRAQHIAFDCRLPVVYLVDSSGFFFHCKRKFFLMKTISAEFFEITPYFPLRDSSICRDYGKLYCRRGYLPVLCDKLLMTEGSGLYLAGPALVKAAIGMT